MYVHGINSHLVEAKAATPAAGVNVAVGVNAAAVPTESSSISNAVALLPCHCLTFTSFVGSITAFHLIWL